MAFKLTKRNDAFLENINVYSCDSSDDLTNIPLTGSDGAPFGSIARCIGDGSEYRLSSAGEWVLQSSGGGGGGGGGSGSALIVTVTITTEEQTTSYTTDKTYNEIKAAYTAGQTVLLYTEQTSDDPVSTTVRYEIVSQIEELDMPDSPEDSGAAIYTPTGSRYNTQDFDDVLVYQEYWG